MQRRLLHRQTPLNDMLIAGVPVPVFHTLPSVIVVMDHEYMMFRFVSSSWIGILLELSLESMRSVISQSLSQE